MTTIINNNIELASRLDNKPVQKGHIRLVPCKNSSSLRQVRPQRSARSIILDIVQVDIGEVFKPSILRMTWSIAHVAAETDFEHFDGLVAV